MRSAAAFVCVAVAGLLAWSPVVAQGSPELSAARSAGTVGERFDGYMGLAAPVSRSVQQQVSAINIRRRSLYIGLAQRRAVTPEVAGIATACQLLARTAVGESYMLKDGAWRRRGPTEPAPRPDYCG